MTHYPSKPVFQTALRITTNTQRPCFYGKCKKFRESSQEVPFRVKISYWFYYNVHNVPNVPSLKRYPIYARHPPLFAMFRLASQLLSPPFIIPGTNGTFELYCNNNTLQRPLNEHLRTFTKRNDRQRYTKNITQKT